MLNKIKDKNKNEQKNESFEASKKISIPQDDSQEELRFDGNVKRKSKIASIIMYIFFGIVVCVVLILASPKFLSAKYFIPLAAINKSLASVGLRVNLNGDAHFAILPRGSIVINDIEITNNDKSVAEIKKFSANIPILSLLLGKIELSDAKINGMNVDVVSGQMPFDGSPSLKNDISFLPSSIDVSHVSLNIAGQAIDDISGKILHDKDGVVFIADFMLLDHAFSANIGMPNAVKCLLDTCVFSAEIKSDIVSGNINGSFKVDNQYKVPFSLADFSVELNTSDFQQFSHIVRFERAEADFSGPASIVASGSVQDGVIKVSKAKFEGIDIIADIESLTVDKDSSQGLVKISATAKSLKRIDGISSNIKLPEKVDAIANFKLSQSSLELMMPTSVNFDSTHAGIVGKIDDKINVSISLDVIDIMKYLDIKMQNQDQATQKNVIPHAIWAPNFSTYPNMAIDLKISNFAMGAIKAKNVKAKITSSDSSTKFNIIDSIAWNGKLAAMYESKTLAGLVKSGNFTWNISNADIGNFLKTRRAYGIFNSSGNVSGNGDTIFSMLQKLSGDFSINGTGAGIKFLNSKALFLLAKDAKPEVAIGTNKSTSIKSFSSTFKTRDGVAQIVKSSAIIDGRRISGSGKVALGTENLNIKLVDKILTSKIFGSISNPVFESSNGKQIDGKSIIDTVKADEKQPQITENAGVNVDKSIVKMRKKASQS